MFIVVVEIKLLIFFRQLDNPTKLMNNNLSYVPRLLITSLTGQIYNKILNTMFLAYLCLFYSYLSSKGPLIGHYYPRPETSWTLAGGLY